MDFANSQTAKNLMDAFTRECQANNKYTYYSAQAKKDGYQQIADIFDETAQNEHMHSKIWYKALHDGRIPTTTDNLIEACADEGYEWSNMYARYAQTAWQEGYEPIAQLFDGVAKIEKEHEARFRRLLSNLKNGLVFSRDGDMVWMCQKCGHIHSGKDAPAICPVCSHPQSYFELAAYNY